MIKQDVNVLLDFSVPSLKKQLELNEKGFYILTNTRAFSEPQAVRIIQNVIQNLNEAVKQTNCAPSNFRFISRGDSTQRGHYHAETQAIIDSDNSTEYHGLILCLAFFGGDPVTIDDIHYLKEKLFQWVKPHSRKIHILFSNHPTSTIGSLRKTKGSVKPSQVISFSLQELRSENAEFLANKLQTAPKDAVIIVNGNKISYDNFKSNLSYRIIFVKFTAMEQDDDLNYFMLGLILVCNRLT